MKIKILIVILIIIISSLTFADFQSGNYYFKNNQYEKAREQFLETSGDFNCIYGIAVTSRFLGDYDKAINNYNILIAKDPKFYEGYLGLGICYQLKGNFDQAILFFNKFLEIKKQENIFEIIANLYILQKKPNLAKNIIKEGLNYFPNSKALKKLMIIVYDS